MNMSSAKRYYPYLDFFRFLAALFVLLVHARCEIFCEYSLLNEESQNLWTILFYSSVSFGLDGVIILFILSGFLVGGRNLEALYRGRISASSFLINRIARIVPPLAGALLFSSVVKFLRGQELSLWSLVGNLLGLQNIVPGVTDEIGVLWTLPYEIWFYVCILSFILLFGKKHRYVVGIILLVLSLSLFLRMQMQYVFIVFLGVVGYFVKDYIPRQKWFIGFILLGIMGTKCIGIFANSGRAYQGPFAGMIDTNISVLISGFFIALLVFRSAVSEPTSKWTFGIDRIGRYMAPISYSLFLTHFSVLELFQHYIGRLADVDCKGILLFIFESVICIVVAWLFYFLFEKNTKKLEQKLRAVFNVNSMA